MNPISDWLPTPPRECGYAERPIGNSRRTQASRTKRSTGIIRTG